MIPVILLLWPASLLVARTGLDPCGPIICTHHPASALAGGSGRASSSMLASVFESALLPVQVNSSVHGRGLQVKRSLPLLHRGTIILAAQQASVVPASSGSQLSCTQCLSSPDTIVRCKHCMQAYYCSVDCIASDNSIHDLLCPGLRLMQSKTLQLIKLCAP